MKQTEANLTKAFREHLKGNYLGSFYHNHHMTGKGVSGFPDVTIALPSLFGNSKLVPTFYLELKKYSGLEVALKNLRPSQKGYAKKLAQSKLALHILYWNGFAKLKLGLPDSAKIDQPDNWINYPDLVVQFDGFDAYCDALKSFYGKGTPCD